MLDTLIEYYVKGYQIGFRVRIGSGQACNAWVRVQRQLQCSTDLTWFAMHWPMFGVEYNPGSGTRVE